MARADTCGLWWDDTPPPKPPKVEKEKRTPPEPVWLRPDYLPGLAEAQAAQIDLFTDYELGLAAARGEALTWDIECYPNYFLVAFKSLDSGKVVYFEMPEGGTLHLAKLAWVLRSFLVIDFNGDRYDVPIISLALAGKSTRDLFAATDMIINGGPTLRPWNVLRKLRVKRIQLNHIDLIQLVALTPSLKLLAGRLHAPRMQDLPFAPGSVLSPEQIIITRWYCINDLDNTALLYKELLPDIKLREKMSARYGIDLRSHSDAQIAEKVISSEICKMTRQQRILKPNIPVGTLYQYHVPRFVAYKTPLMNWVLAIVKDAWFGLKASGKVIMPDEIKTLKIHIGGSTYALGVGGLHSTEKRAAHIADDEVELWDRDVASYYPRIILNCGLAPRHLGIQFLQVYNALVVERLKAKEAKDKTAADGLKIVVNGSFGKLGSKYSALYAPDLMIQVTITGQLCLLMLIERLELAGIPVISANTDGAVIKCPKARRGDMEAIVAQWERDTGFETEATSYKALYSRDVNNYIAVKQDGTCKIKGIYAEKGSSRNSILSKNPTNRICSDAVIATITTGVPVDETIRACADIRKFLTVRTVKGGAVKDGQYLGKAIRWYYAKDEEGEIIYARSGNKVPRTDGARPLMQLPDALPADVDLDWYEREAMKILVHIGFLAGDVPEEDEDDEDDSEDEEE